jgi:hypothetical protein
MSGAGGKKMAKEYLGQNFHELAKKIKTTVRA